MIEPRLIRKYANRRLYDTVRSQYVNLVDVRHLIAEGSTIRVVDQSSGRDITNSILLQIIGGMEKDSSALLTSEFLTDLIRVAGKSNDPGLAMRLQNALSNALAFAGEKPGNAQYVLIVSISDLDVVV
jgi:polyhydroxyalkanoate synthesis repressor PhaR